MDLKTLAETIARLGAPLIGTVLGGPAGSAIGSIIAAEFGGNSNNLDDLVSKINSDPNAASKLAEIQSNQKIQLQNIAMQMAANDLKAETDRQAIAADDSASARKMKADTKSYMPEMMSVIIMLGMSVCIWIASQVNEPANNQDILYMLFGSVSSAFGAVVQFWLGSSAGSKIKDATIHKMTNLK